ncbi:beta strand repeat-containing protein [Oleiharenicola lentus]|uniref:beta strand repeat-containing protein n=1 Tax=Oleiharenicola lentus TaxID=2508720 RepID=UPI003F679D71
MKKDCLFVACILGLVHLATAPAVAQVYGVGDLPGGIAYSEVRDATRVSGVIHAVGGSSANSGSTTADTAFLWKSTTGIAAIPNVVTNTTATNFVTASAITPDGAYLASRSRTNTAALRQAVRVTSADLSNLNFGGVGGFSDYSAAAGISSDGSVLVGFKFNPALPEYRAVRFTATGPTATVLPFLNAGDNESFPAARGISANGNVIVGNSYVYATTQGQHAAAGNNAFRFVQGTGISAIPKLTGGTWNSPLALSPDGNLSLVAGNSTLYPAGAVYLHNATSGALTELGSPNAAWGPTNVGGMTADGAVVVVSFGSNETTSTSQSPYFRNAHGWFHLKSAAAALAGANVTGWDFGAVFGISADGTLVFGSGQHNGATEGYVIDFPAGYLANYHPAPVAPAQTSIVGTWTAGDTTSVGAALLTFLPDGTYFHIQTATPSQIADGGANGFERGNYTWNAATGAFGVVTKQDTNGDIGLSDLNGTAGSTISVSGNTLTLTPAGEGPFVLTRVTQVAGTLTGAWAVDDGDGVVKTVAVFLANGRYYLADDGEPELGDGGPGMETGTYTWNASTGAFSATALTDTNGQWGLSHLQPPTVAQLSTDIRKLFFTDGGETTPLNRIAAAVATPITVQPQNLTVTSGTDAVFSVTVANPAGTTFQWRRNGIPLGGATGATYTIPAAKRVDADRYDVVVTVGSDIFVSNPTVLSVAPTAYPGILGVDTSFAPTPLTISTRIFSAIALPDGKWMVGGEFSRWDTTPRSFLARLNADFSLDTGFVPPVINGFVYAIARASDGSIYVGGEFTSVGYHGSPGLFRLKPDGSHDLAWQPDDNPPKAAVTALAVQADGKLLVGRQSTFINGQIVTSGTNVLRRLNLDGSHDTSFNVDIVTNSNRLNAIISEASGSVVFAGLFTTVNGSARNGVARVSSTGALDTAFAGGIGTNANAQVFSIVPVTGGGYLLGGTFTQLAGVNRNRAGKLNADGSLNTAFVPASNNGNVLGVAALADGRAILAGAFTMTNGQPSHGIVRLTTTGTVDQYFTAVGGSTSFATSTAARTLFVFPQANGSTAFIGGFQSLFNQRRTCVGVIAADGTLAASPAPLLYRPAYTGSAYALPGGQSVVFGSIDTANGVAGQVGQALRVNDNGSVDASFPVGSGFNLNGLSTFGIYRAVRQSDGKFLAVGDLSGYNGNTATRLARINSDGTFDATFAPGSGPNVVFPPITAISGGRTLIYGGGTTLTYNGSAIARMFRILSNGSRDTTFNLKTGLPATAGFGFVYEQPDGRMIVASGLTSYDGVATSGFFRMLADGSFDPSFTPGTGPGGGSVNYVAGLPDGRMVIAGTFATYNGIAASRVAIISANGVVDTSFNAASVIDAPVGYVLPQEDGKLIVVGDFTGTPTPYVARLSATGTLDTSFALHGVSTGFGAGLRLFISDDGSVYAHNQVMSANDGVPVGYLRFRGAPVTPTIAVQPVGFTAAYGSPGFLTVRVNGTGPFTYQWYRNGVIMEGETNSVLATTSLNLDANASFTVTVTGPTGVSVTSNAAVITITGGAAVQILDQPFGRKAVAGGKVLFRVTASGGEPLSYQWKKNGADIPNAVTADLWLNNLTSADATNYSVVVTNSLGSVTSAAAALQVLTPDNVLWQEFNDYTVETAPGRTFADGAGKIYVPWTTLDRTPDMVGGRFAGALARFDEATGNYDATFRLDPIYRRVMHMARQPDGKLVLAVSLGDTQTVIRVSATGVVDSTFNAPNFARSIRFITRQNDGKIVVAATDNLSASSPAGSIATASSILRLNADGSVDAGFAAATLGGNALLFGAPMVDGANRVYLAGAFSAVNGTARTNVARLNVDGTLDTAYAASLPAGFSSVQARGVDFQSDGRAVFVGEFSYTARGSGGDPIQAIRFNTDGSFDTTFVQPLRSQLGFNAAVSARARHVVVLPSDKLVLVSTRLVRLNADGSKDNSFASYTYQRESFWISRGASGDYYVPDQSGINGVSVTPLLPIWGNGVMKFDEDGLPDYTFQTGGFGRLAYPASGRVVSDGSVWLGGGFNRYGATVLPGVAHFNAPGTLAAAQAAAPSGSPENFRHGPFAGVAAAAGDQTYVISGLPTSTAGTLYSAVRRLNANGSEDATFSAVLPAGYNLITASPFAGADGKLMLAQGTVAAVVALNGGAGDSLLRLNVNGTRDTTYTPALTSFASVERNPANHATAPNAVTMIRTGGLNVAQVLPDGRALVVVSAVDGNLRLLRLNANGTEDTSFVAPSFGTITPSVGNTTNITDPVTGTTTQFPITTYSAADLVRTAVQMADGKVYVGGRFTLAGVPRGLVRLNANGSLDTTFTGTGIATTSIYATPYVSALTTDSSGRLYVAGRFTSFNGTATSGLFRLKADATFDTAFAPGFSLADVPRADAQLIVANNKLYAFGTVASASAPLPAGYAVAEVPYVPLITAQPVSANYADGSVQALSVTVSGAGPFTYQWFRDGVAVTGATTNSLTFDRVTPANAGSYTVVVTSGGQSTTSSAAVITVTPSAPVFYAANNTFSNFGRILGVGTSDYLTAAPLSGSEPMTYQWHFNGAPISGATGRTLMINNWQPANAGAYAVTITNSLGSGTSPADLYHVATEAGWKWRSPLPTGNGLTRVKFVNGQFIAGGIRGTLLTSADGLTWTQRPVAANNNLLSVAYGNGLYVMIGSLNAVFTSTDGINWQPGSTGLHGAPSQLQEVAFGNGKFVATGTGGVISTSTNGLNWTTGSLGAGNTEQLAGLHFDGDFIAISSGNKVYVSADGITWTQEGTTPAGLNSFASDPSATGLGVAVGDNGAIHTTSDGITWTARSSGTTNQLIGINYVNNQFIATGALGTIVTSPTGVTWTVRNSGGNQSNLQSAAFGNGRYVIVGQAGNTGRTLLTSTDGVTWTSSITGPYQGTHLNGVASNNGSTAVAVGNGGAIVSTSDLTTWIQRASGSTDQFTDVAFGNGKYVAVGANGNVTVGTVDGTTWSKQATDSVIGTNGLNGVRFADNQWIVTGNGGRIYTAPDAQPFVWISRTTNTTQALRKVVAGAGRYVAVGAGGVITTSSDLGATWTVRTSGTGLLLLDVAYGNGKYVAVGQGGVVVTSTDAVTWSAPTSLSTAGMNGITFAQSQFIATAGINGYFTSADGITWTGRVSGAFDLLLDVTAHGTGSVIGVGNFGTIMTAGTVTRPLGRTVTVNAGSPVVLNALSSETPIPVAYQWSKAGTPIAGETSYVYRIASATSADAGSYSVSSLNNFGGGSASITLVVNSPPSITAQPLTGSAPENGTLFLSVTASGSGALSYQWFKDGVAITGQNGPSLSIPAASGSYTVTITSAFGTVTSNAAVVTVVPSAPAFNASGNIQGTFGQVMPAGTSALLTAVPSAGTLPISYQWQFNGADIPGQTASTYYLPDWQPQHAGAYAVRATNSIGTTTSPAEPIYVSPEGGWRWRNPTLTGNGLTRVTFLNGQFLVGGLRGTLLASTDGASWTNRPLPAANNLFNFQYVNGTYVAMGSLNGIFTSTDGVIWTPRTTGINGAVTSLQDMTSGNGRLVAVGSGGVTATSTDGITWAVGSLGNGRTDTLFGATYVLNKFFAVSGNNGDVFSSPDGVTWTASATGAPTLRNLTYGAGRLVAVGDGGVIVTSTNGTSWAPAVSGTTNFFTGISFVNNQFIACGALGTILTSPDGVTWTARSAGGNQSNLQNASYGNGRYVIVGQAGNNGKIMLTSTDSITWTSSMIGPRQTINMLSVAASGSAVVAVGNAGAIISSTDRATWTDRVSGTGVALSDVTYASGKFVAVGNAGNITVSTDGATWALQSASSTIGTTSLLGVRYTGSQWVAVGDFGRIYTAPDALPFVWTQRTSPVTTNLRKVTFANGLHLAVGVGGNILTSPDAITWTRIVLAGNPQLNDVTFGNGVYVAVGVAGRVAYSSDAVTWTSIQPSVGALSSVNFINGTFIATGSGHTYYTSTDGMNWIGRFTGSFDPINDTTLFGGEIVGAGNFGTVITAGAPVIASPGNFTASTGTATILKFAVSNSPTPVTYTWTKDSAPLVGAPNSPILVIPSATAGNAGVYQLTATNAFGSAVSSSVTLTLNVGIAITAQPTPQTALVGGSATFSVTATGTPAPTYQWRLKGVNIAGATSSSVTLTNVQPADAGLVSVVLTNAGGSVTSNAVQLTVNPIAPVITSPLVASTVANAPFSYQIGTNQTTATFTAAPLPNGLVLNATTGIISGTPTQIGTTNITLGASNVTGSDSEVLQLTVQAPPPIIGGAASVDGRVGVAFSFTITASNSPTAFFATNLPPGLTLSGATISGTPTAAGYYSVTVTAQNATGSNARALTIQIAPPLNAPVFTGSTTPSGTAGGAFSYTPAFGAGNTNYALVNLPNGSPSVLPSGLTLNATTGEITGTTTQTGTFQVAIRATNADGSTTVVLTFTFNPALTAPLFTSNSSVIATVGTAFNFTLTTSPAATTFAAVGLPTGLSLTASTGAISGTPVEPGISAVTVTATNASGSSSATLTITVNSSALAPVLSSAPVAQGRVASPFTFTNTATNAAESYAVVLGTLPNGLSLNIATGAVTGTPTVAGQTSVWFAASNTAGGRGPALEVLFNIDRALNVPTITSNGTANAQVGQSFLYQITATNSPTAYASSTLPDGLTLSATTGVISGIPAAQGSADITLTATNGDGISAPKLLTLTIAAPPATPSITSSTAVGGRVGVALSYQTTASESPNSFAADQLPAGLSINSTTGLISGTPTVAGVVTVQLRAANNAGLGQPTAVSFNFAAALTAPAITSAPTSNGKVGTLFSYTITASNTPTSFAVQGVLPAGVSLNTATGVISGNPADAPGAYSVVVTATNSAGTSQPQPLLITIAPADNTPVITSATSAPSMVGAAFSYQITATNVPAAPFPPSVFLDALHLPPGLAVNPSTGFIQGTPLAAGTYTVTLVGINANGTGSPRELTITVSPAANAPVVNSASNASAQVGVAFSYQITATNVPTAFEALDAPAWLSVNTATGRLAGTPTAPGSVAILLRAANSAGASTLAPLSLSIAAAPNTPVVTSVRDTSGKVGVAFVYDVTATLTPTTYRAAGLPPMLSINPATGAIRGTPTVSGTFRVIISATNTNGEGQPVTLTITITPSIQVGG